jgi:hypothetical protein
LDTKEVDTWHEKNRQNKKEEDTGEVKPFLHCGHWTDSCKIKRHLPQAHLVCYFDFSHWAVVSSSVIE